VHVNIHSYLRLENTPVALIAAPLCVLQAVDKLLSVMTLIVASIFGLQAVGLDGAHTCPELPLMKASVGLMPLCSGCVLMLTVHSFDSPAVNSVLAIGGVGGLAIGLAGREILENLFTVLHLKACFATVHSDS
jgi:hypothetical protein